MLKLTGVEIITADDIHDPIPEGYIVANGESGGAVVKINVPSPGRDKAVPLDTLDEASYTQDGESWIITGKSWHLMDVVGVDRDNAEITVVASPMMSQVEA